SSFQYIRGKSGWGQDHFFQFKKNNFTSLHYNRNTRLREWIPDSLRVTIDVYNDISMQNAYYINGTMQEYSVCSWNPALFVGVIDPFTFETWGTNYNGANPDHDFGSTLCRSRVEKFFIFYQDDLQQLQSFQNMVLNEVPDGHYMVIYTPIAARYSKWDELDSVNMYQTFRTLGSDSIIPGRPEQPFAFFVRKGYPNTVVEHLMDSITGTGSENGYNFISMDAYIPTSMTRGMETSTLIGPALKWGNVYWKQDGLDQINNSDSTRLIIQPYDWNMNPGPAINLLFSHNDSLLNLENTINAVQHPYLKLTADYRDSTNFTPAQMDRWHVLYDLAPEAAIDATNGFYFSHLTDSVQEGDYIKFAIDVKNIFTVDMDSLLINYWIEDQNNVKHTIAYPRQDSLRVGQVIRDTISVPSLGMSGFNTLWMEVNPYINGSLYLKDQPEQYHFNNIMQI